MSVDDRAKKVINDSLSLGLPKLIMPVDITKGNEKLNTLFVA